MSIVPSVALVRSGWETEHPVERQSIVNFVTYTLLGRLPTHLTQIVSSQFGVIPETFWTMTGRDVDITTLGFPRWPVPDPEPVSVRRLMHCVGSNALEDVFTVAPDYFNRVKGAVSWPSPMVDARSRAPLTKSRHAIDLGLITGRDSALTGR